MVDPVYLLIEITEGFWKFGLDLEIFKKMSDF